MLNYILIGIIIFLLIQLNKIESFTNAEKQIMADAIYNNRDKLNNYNIIKNELNWMDPVMYSDSVELFRSNKLSSANIIKIFD